MVEQSSEEPINMDETSEESPEVMPTLDDIVTTFSLDESDKSALEARAVQGQGFPCLSQDDMTGMMKDEDDPLGTMACRESLPSMLLWEEKCKKDDGKEFPAALISLASNELRRCTRSAADIIMAIEKERKLKKQGLPQTSMTIQMMTVKR